MCRMFVSNLITVENVWTTITVPLWSLVSVLLCCRLRQNCVNELYYKGLPGWAQSIISCAVVDMFSCAAKHNQYSCCAII